MWQLDSQNLDALAFELFRDQLLEGPGKLQLAKIEFDGDLPKTGHAQEKIILQSQHGPRSPPTQRRRTFDEPQKAMGVEKDSQGWRLGIVAEIFERSIEVIGQSDQALGTAELTTPWERRERNNLCDRLTVPGEDNFLSLGCF